MKQLILLLLSTIVINCQNDDYRLDTKVVPNSYSLDLTIDPDFGETDVFSGQVTIFLEVQEATNTFELHGSGLNITSYILRTTTTSTNLINSITYNSTTEKYKIIASQSLSVSSDRYYLVFVYTAKIYDDMNGFYKSWYTNEDGEKVWLAVTQFQPTYARRAFPCFDEPNKKAYFEVSITRPTTLRALSNTALSLTTSVSDGYEKDLFGTTPKMSTYLVAFIVSDFATINDPINKNGIWARDETIGIGDYGYHIAPKLVSVYNNFTNIDYLSTGIGKLDQVAIPDFDAGAMENWGLITYREYGLLWDPEESNQYYKKYLATTISHELAHMWFGNLVTCDWWSYTWLNEGFAQYMQYMITAQIETTWELEKQFVILLVQGIFGSDSTESSSALNSNASTTSEIGYKFASISYYKGASIIRMMRDFLGADNFQKGIQLYLSNNANSTAVPDDLWEALDTYSSDVSLPANMSTIMSTWTDQAGFPIVTVSLVDSTTVSITQKRFLYNSSLSSDLTYYVPISFTNSTVKDFDTVFPSHWLVPNKELEISNALSSSGWILVNIQETGYYRVNYDETLWNRLISALKSSNYDGIDVLNRAQLINDAMNLARSGVLSYKIALDVVSYLSTETEYYPWYAALNAFSHLRKRTANSTELRAYLESHIIKLMSKVNETISFDYDPNETQPNILKKAAIFELACELGVESCITQANALFEKLKNDNYSITPDMRSTVYCSAIRTATTSENWYFLWNKYLNTKLATEMNVILSALGCTKNDTLRTEYIIKSITSDSGIRSQDSASVFQSIYTKNMDGVDLAYSFLKENFETIANYYGGQTSVGSIISGIADRFTTEAQITDLNTFIEENEKILGGALSTAKSALESARANVAWTDMYSSEMLEWFETTYGTSGSTLPVIHIFFIIFSVFLFLA